MNVFVFDIETIPDVEGARKIYPAFADLKDSDILAALAAKQREKTGGNEFLPLYLHRIVCISVVLYYEQKLKVWSLGDIDAPEQEIVTRFFKGIQKYTPLLVSWNGTGFDLPVIHYRALLHGVAAPQYWETGGQNTQFRYNNYLNRYHERHLDLMDVLSGYQPRAFAPLDNLAALLGFPGKMGMSGSKVTEHFFAGQIKMIRDYCETDVLNTYLMYLRFQLIRGQIDQVTYQQEIERLRDYLTQSNQTHFTAFVQAWS